MIFLSSSNMTSLNTFFSFFNMSANEFLKRYRKLMLKVNLEEMKGEEGTVDYAAIYQKYLFSDIEYNTSIEKNELPEEQPTEDEEYICVCSIKDLYFLYMHYKYDLWHLSYEDFKTYLRMYKDGRLENYFPPGELFYALDHHTFLKPLPIIDDAKTKSKFIYYPIEIYYNHESNKYEYVE